MRKLFLIILSLVICISFLQAQVTTVSGRVVDSAGKPISGASVTITGSRKGTATNSNGDFSIEAQRNQTLKVSAVGFEPLTFSPGTNLLLRLIQTATALQEVVVTALGIRREKKALGYSVATIDKKQLEQRPDGDIARLLSGKAPGVDILASSGISGSGTNIQIRGANSITGGSDPLWVVDGTPISGATNQQTDVIYGNQTSSRFMDLDPNNVESISILKGLSATVLYGEAGRNGVILVTTKNGAGRRTNKKTEVTFTQSYFVNQPSSLPELQNTYGGGFSLTGGFAFFSNWGPKFTTPYQRLPHPYSQGIQVGSFPELANDSIEFKPHDNFKAFFKDGHVVNTAVNVSAAMGNNGTVNASFSRLSDQGFLATNKVSRNNFALGINTKLLNNISVSGTINYVTNNFQSPTTAQAGASGAQSGGAGVYADLMYTPRANDLANWPYQTPDGASAYYRPDNSIQNPMWTLYNSISYQQTNRAFGNFNVKYSLFKNLDLLYRVGYDYYNENHILTINKGGVTRSGELEYTKGIYRTISANNKIWDHSLIAQYQTDFSSKIRFDLTGGFNSNEEIYDQTGMKSTEQLVFGLFDHSNFINHDTRAEDGSDMDVKSEQQSVGVFAQAGISYNEYVYLNVGARNSWASTLEKANRSQFYPSASISFVPTSALNFLKGNKIINYLKIRSGYATGANFPGPYRTRPSLIISTNDFVTRGGAVVNTNTISNTLANPNLKPELLKEFETGFEARLINNRVSIDFTWYKRISSDQILTRPLDPSTGFERTTINAGDLVNKGIELGLGFTPVKTKKLAWQIDVNFSRNRSLVRNLPAEIAQVQTGGLFSNLGNFAINGQPFNVIKGTYYQKDPKSGLRIVGQDGYYIPSTESVIIGDPNADYRVTAINTVSFKGFEFRMQWDLTKGGVIYANTVNTLISRGLAKSTDVDRTIPIILPGVKQDGTPNDIQTSIDRAYFNTYLGAHEQFLYDATVFRLRELSLSYVLSPSVLTKTPFGGISFTLSGQNLWHKAPYFPEGSNYDPESSSGGVSKTRGFEFMTGPQSRRMGATIKVTF